LVFSIVAEEVQYIASQAAKDPDSKSYQEIRAMLTRDICCNTGEIQVSDRQSRDKRMFMMSVCGENCTRTAHTIYGKDLMIRNQFR